MEGRHRLQDPSAAARAAALAASDDPLHCPARRLSRPQIRWRAGNPDPVARPPANGRHHRRLSQLPHRLRHAAMTRPTVRTPPRDPNDRQQTAYSSLSDADLWGKISDQIRRWKALVVSVIYGTCLGCGEMLSRPAVPLSRGQKKAGTPGGMPASSVGAGRLEVVHAVHAAAMRH